MGQNFAAHKFARVAEARLIMAKFCLFYGLALAAVLAVIAVPLTALFTETPAIRDVAADYLWIMAISYGGYGLVMSTCAAFNGMGQPGPGLIISVTRVVVLFLPLAWVGKMWFGLHGIFAASAFSNIAVAVIGFIWLGHRIRRAGESVENIRS